MCRIHLGRLRFARQTGVPVLYKGVQIAEHRPDLVVNEEVVVG
jgi:hypothetical protein